MRTDIVKNSPASHDALASVENAAPSEKPPVDNSNLESWLTVVAGFCVFVNSWGLLSTYGAFQEYYQTVLLPTVSPSVLSWVGSAQATFIVLIGIVTGPLVDAGYVRPLMIIGCFLTVFGMMMTSLATSYYQVLLAQGFCAGIGGGIAYIPSLAVISSNFSAAKRPIAIGLASIGSSIGSVVYPILFRRLQPQIGFPWTVRIIAFITFGLSLIICAVLCRHPGHAAPTRRSLIDRRAILEPTFMLYSVSLTCIMLAYYIPIFYVPTYARTSSLHTSKDLSFYMLAIVNGASTFGRTMPYLLLGISTSGSKSSDKNASNKLVKPIYILVFSTVGSALAMFTWLAVKNTAGFIVWLCYWGFLTGILVTAPTSIIAHPILCPDMNFIGTRLGMMWGISSFGGLAGTPIAGALVDLETGEFWKAQVFGGCMMVVAALLQAWPTFRIVRYDRRAMV
ncbi:major facilitator superfamily domain-containing protein [Talaromyces proteolyticus]|uniref:Major facilitator superfamily domain-containing protein n=1 Tax=Talaromyces proteolyticus TaxID=1131652 RepID=A0AAD4PT67_9EURO|nr:major facilitator superfamily domain-containing protein [Talaromyces proteolyticus]KAH8690264.1 major facilitator superfamily domain-containing protein [Talaromyces proteolyticus]